MLHPMNRITHVFFEVNLYKLQNAWNIKPEDIFSTVNDKNVAGQHAIIKTSTQDFHVNSNQENAIIFVSDI